MRRGSAAGTALRRAVPRGRGCTGLHAMAAAPQHDSPHSWLRLLVTLAVATVGSVGIWAPVTVLPAMQADFGTDRGAASLPYTAAMIGFALGSRVAGRPVDRWGIAPAPPAAAAAVAGPGFGAAAATGSLAMQAALRLALGPGAAACCGPLTAAIPYRFLRRPGIAGAATTSPPRSGR